MVGRAGAGLPNQSSNIANNGSLNAYVKVHLLFLRYCFNERISRICIIIID